MMENKLLKMFLLGLILTSAALSAHARRQLLF